MDAMLMITPPPCGIICFTAHFEPRNTPLRLICTTVFQPLIEMSSGLALDAAPQAQRGEGGAVRLGARGELVDELPHLIPLAPRRLGGAPDVVVVRPLGLEPRLLEVRHEYHELIRLSDDVGVPPRGAAN